MSSTPRLLTSTARNASKLTQIISKQPSSRLGASASSSRNFSTIHQSSSNRFNVSSSNKRWNKSSSKNPFNTSNQGENQFTSIDFFPLLSHSLTAPSSPSSVRTMFIQTESTPNEDSLKFLPGQKVMESGSHEFLDIRSSM